MQIDFAFNDPAVEVSESSSIVQSLLSIDPKSVELALGKPGEKLREFLETVDTSHPHLSSIISDIFDHPEDVCEVLQLADYAHKNNLSKAFSAIKCKINDKKGIYSHIRLLKT